MQVLALFIPEMPPDAERAQAWSEWRGHSCRIAFERVHIPGGWSYQENQARGGLDRLLIQPDKRWRGWGLDCVSNHISLTGRPARRAALRR